MFRTELHASATALVLHLGADRAKVESVLGQQLVLVERLGTGGETVLEGDIGDDDDGEMDGEGDGDGDGDGYFVPQVEATSTQFVSSESVALGGKRSAAVPAAAKRAPRKRKAK